MNSGAANNVGFPERVTLPLFTYGLFKPGQLGFFRIGEFVEKASTASVKGRLKERDGLPLLVLGGDSIVTGTILHFFRGEEKKALQRIAKIEPREVYVWQEISPLPNEKVNRANALVGRRELRGSSELEYVETWKGEVDPYFSEALEVVKEVLKSNQHLGRDLKPLFRIQMAYYLLWSALERYASLRYHLGPRATEKVNKVAGELAFAKALAQVVNEPREVFSTTDLQKYKLNPKHPKASIKYYYQVRSNSAHRGKAVTRDFETVKQSTQELLTIFRAVLKAAFADASLEKSQSGSKN